MKSMKMVKKAQAGDTEAFGFIYDEFSSRLFRYIRVKVGDTTTAEDLLQEAFVKAWKADKHGNLIFK